MSKKSIWEKIDESESFQTFFIVVMVMLCITFFSGLVFLGIKLLSVI